MLISARSPFARRVRLALREHGIRYSEKVLDVFKPTSELYALNPLARVPVIQFASGEALSESEKILALLYASRPDSPFQPRSAQETMISSFWSGMALGLAEKSVEYYLETLRPEGGRDQELLQEIREIAARVLDRFNAFVGERDTILEGHLTQVDFDMASALTYFSLRYSTEWQSRYPRASAYLRRLEERPSFQGTRPPAA